MFGSLEEQTETSNVDSFIAFAWFCHQCLLWDHTRPLLSLPVNDSDLEAKTWIACLPCCFFFFFFTTRTRKNTAKKVCLSMPDFLLKCTSKICNSAHKCGKAAQILGKPTVTSHSTKRFSARSKTEFSTFTYLYIYCAEPKMPESI